MTGRVSVRRARPDEYGRIGDLTVEAYLGLPDGGAYPDYLEELRDVAGRASDVDVLVAVDEDGTVLGGVTYVRGPGPWFEGQAEDEAEFRALAVAPGAQGRGVGRALVEACIERARRDGRGGIGLYTRPSMFAAHRVYERLGFVRVPERDWQFEPGEWLLGYRLALTPAAGGPLIADRPKAHAPAVPRPASTVVLVRDVDGGIEVLLSHRPSTMAFAPDVHVFPGGAVDPADRDPRLGARSRLDAASAAARLGGGCLPDEALAFHVAAIRELFEEAGVLLAEAADPLDRDMLVDPAEVGRARSALVAGRRSFADLCEALDLELRTDALVPLSHWVTPPTMPRRFDTRFFAARLPAGAEPSVEGEEVVAHRWLRPGDAVSAIAAGSLRLWVPTAANLQRLAFAASFEEVAALLASGSGDPPEAAVVAPDILRVRQAGAAGVDGVVTNTYLVGGHHVVVVDPGDPSEEALLAIVEAVRAEDATVAGVAITSPDADHAGGAEHLREALGVLVHATDDAAATLPFPVERLEAGGRVRAGDVRVVTLRAPGPRPEHLVLQVPSSGTVLCGDLLGGAARSIPGPPDPAAWRASLALVRSLRPRRLLPAHDEPVEGEAEVEAALAAAADRFG